MMDFLFYSSSINESAPDIPLWFTALAEWLACMMFLATTTKQSRKFSMLKFIAISAAFLVGLVGWHFLYELFPTYLFLVRMIVAFAIMVALIYTLKRLSIKEALYRALGAFLIAEFAAALEWQINYFLQDAFGDTIAVSLICLCVIYIVIYTIVFFVEKRYLKNEPNLNYEKKDVILIALLTILVFSISNLSFILPDTPFSSMNASEIFYIRTLVDFCGVAFFYFQREHHLSLYAKEEIKTMQVVMDRHYEQYCHSKENAEKINKQIHDFKHHLFAIRQETDMAKREEYFDNLEKNLKTVESDIKTGSKVLDTILYSKALVCAEKKIAFTPVVNGPLLKFVELIDLCSIFGNILDNAIEGADNVTDKDARLIKLAVYAQGDIVIIKSENYYEKALDFTNGELHSTKKDKALHGYGLKSIKSLATKYGGTTKFTMRENWFTLVVLLPMSENL